MKADRSIYIVMRTEGEYESRDYPVCSFDSEPAAATFAKECKSTFEQQHNLFTANRARHGERWWSFGAKKTDAIEARYERKLADPGCGIRNSDISWGVWEVKHRAR